MAASEIRADAANFITISHGHINGFKNSGETANHGASL